MIKVSIIGSGNVAQHLIAAFTDSDPDTEIELVQVFSRKKATLAHLIDPGKIVDNLSDLSEADLYIIAVTDGAIETVSAQLPFSNRLVVHTSGSIPLTGLSANNRKGVFYPLQTFTKNVPVAFSTIPICLESENTTDYKILEKIAKSISNSVFAINSEQRKALHVAAVFVNNFVNHLYQIGNEICDANQMPFEILKPLIKETADKIATLSPNEAQTGPAKRLDLETINAHLNFLKDKNQKEIYEIITQSIITNGKKL